MGIRITPFDLSESFTRTYVQNSLPTLRINFFASFWDILNHSDLPLALGAPRRVEFFSASSCSRPSAFVFEKTHSSSNNSKSLSGQLVLYLRSIAAPVSLEYPNFTHPLKFGFTIPYTTPVRFPPLLPEYFSESLAVALLEAFFCPRALLFELLCLQLDRSWRQIPLPDFFPQWHCEHIRYLVFVVLALHPLFLQSTIFPMKIGYNLGTYYSVQSHGPPYDYPWSNGYPIQRIHSQGGPLEYSRFS